MTKITKYNNNNNYWSENEASVSDAGISFVNTFQEALNDATTNDKLLLVYFHDQTNHNECRFISLLLNEDINSLFKRDFCIFATDAQNKRHIQEFKQGLGEHVLKYLGNSIEADVLYTINVKKEPIELVSTLNVNETSQEDILVELYIIHEAFNESLMDENDELVTECMGLFTQKYSWLNFPIVPINDALEMTMNQPLKHLRKVLMVYMYKSNSVLSDLFNHHLGYGSLAKFNRLLVPVIWDISDAKYHKQLRIACDRYFGEDILKKTVDSEEGGIFFFLPDDAQLKSVPKIFTAITSLAQYDPSNLAASLDCLFEEFQEVNQITDLHEISAIESFTRSVPLTHFCVEHFQMATLHDVTEKCLQAPRKMLLLYFGTSFSKLWTKIKSLSDTLNMSKVLLLTWDTSVNETTRMNLTQALRRTFGVQKLEAMLQSGKDALFIFVPIGNTLILHSVLEEGASERQLKNEYREAYQFFRHESEIAEQFEDTSGPAKYQQVMCEQLGDRAFDCFQLDKGEDQQLREKISFAFFGPPTECDVLGDQLMLINRDEQKKREKRMKCQKKQVDTMYKKMTEIASKYGENEDKLYISFMRVCITPMPQEKAKKHAADAKYEAHLDFGVFPLFGVRKCFDCPPGGGNTACRVYIDHTGRVYQGWGDFLENNHYPPVMLIAPKNGRYTADYRDNVQLEICPSPACGIGPAILKGVDIGVTVLGIAAGVAGVATTMVAVPFLPVIAMGTGLSVGVYSIVRSSIVLVDRFKYDESMQFSSAEARGAYLNILAGSLGFTTAGVTFALSYMAKTGVTVGLAARATVNGIQVANVAASGAAIGNSAYDVISQWNEDGTTNTLAVLQLTSSVLFFGHAVYNVQSANTIINNAQSTTMTEILESLSSNRQRKAMMRLLKTTIDKAGGNVQTGHSEVISYIKNVDNVADVARILTRDTKLMSKHGVKYSVDNGKIVFNGVEMNVNEFGNMSKMQRAHLLAEIPSVVNDARPATSVQATKSTVMQLNTALKLLHAGNGLLKLVCDPSMSLGDKVNNLLSTFTPYIQRQLSIIAGKFLEKIGLDNDALYASLVDLVPNSRMILFLLREIIQYFKDKGIPEFVPDYAKSSVKRVVNLLDLAIMISMFSIDRLLYELVNYCSRRVVEMFCDASSETASNNGIESERNITRCDKCLGNFYS